MRYSLSLALLLSVAVYAARPVAIVDLGYAKYEGGINNQTGNFEFFGIRYAAAPKGSLRWRAPQIPQTVSGIQKADTHPDTCWQTGAGTQPGTPFPTQNNHQHQKRDAPPSSEDCLFLNVATPVSGNGSLPVVVWIHGGGYMGGSAFGFEGDDLVREAGSGVVAVAIQYRLGVFGFLSSQKIHDGGALNVALLDQRFALQWVQRHISKFGGNPNRVTIWGESAGAGSVLQHIVADNGKTHPPLFHAAITSSTFLPSQYAFNDSIPEQLFSAVVNGTGCSAAKDALECLRQMDVNLLQEINVNVGNSGFFGTYIFVPVVDGVIIKKRPTKLLRDGRVNGEALLAITNTVEGTLFVDSTTALSVHIPEYLVNLFPRFDKLQVEAASKVYASIGAPIDQAIAIMGESIFICPTYFLLRAFKGRGFKGEFAIPPGGHAQDVIYYFPSLAPGVPPPYNNTTFINNFSQSFLNFALAMDPNVKWDPANSVPRWSRWSDGGTEMLFSKTDAGDPVFRSIETSEALLRRCNFWESVSALSTQ